MGRSRKKGRVTRDPTPGSRLRRPPTLGIDVGGVLVDRVSEGSDTSFFGGRPMETPAVPGALEALPQLLQLFEHRVHIVSKAGPKISSLTSQWLGEHEIISPEQIPAGNVHFVRKRPEKQPICDKLGITHFIDDRLDVLAHLMAVEHRYLFTGGLGGHNPPTQIPHWATVVKTWPRLLGLLIRDIDRS